MTPKNYYSILGLRNDASLDDIKKAYRKLAFRYHPDHNRGGVYGEERFRELKEAYDLLSDPIRRRQYDAAMRAQHLYAPSYAFGKFTTPYPHPHAERQAAQNTEEAEPEPVPRGKLLFLWIKPVVFFLVAILVMWLIMNPPAWLSAFLAHGR